MKEHSHVIKHSRLENHPFTWPKATQRALKHALTRSIHLARTNTDYQIKHPNECRDNPDNKVLAHCHPEAEKRIIKDQAKIIERAFQPSVERPKRLSRVG